jgi:RHS repeat-associated protein
LSHDRSELKRCSPDADTAQAELNSEFTCTQSKPDPDQILEVMFIMMRDDCLISDTSFHASNLIYRAALKFSRHSIPTALMFIVWGLFACPAAVMGQDPSTIQHTQNKPDQALRSEARVDPSTHGMSIEIPLGMLPGRAGVNVPVSITYSSKVWRLGDAEGFEGVNANDYRTHVRALFAEDSAAGWTTSVSMPRIQLSYQEMMYSEWGDDCGGDQCLPNVARIHVHLSDGSSHELRRSELPNEIDPAEYASGFYDSVDGAQMRVDLTNKVLYLPDGSRYLNFVFLVDGSLQATKYIDRNGNTLLYDKQSRKLTDTLGRTINSPLPAIPYDGSFVSPNDYQYSLPGANGTPLIYTFKWDYLVDPTTGHTLMSGGTLSYLGNKDCTTTYGTYPDQSPYLFTHYSRTYICGDEKFNPVLLSEIVLPNGTSYKFTYNRYGEITKIIYPTGGYERFVHSIKKPLTLMKRPYHQGNRGVMTRYVSAGGPNDVEAAWQYDATYNEYVNAYIVSMTAPDGTITKRLLYAHPEPYLYPYESAPYGFDDALLGRAYDEQVYRQDEAMLRRKLTQWTVDSTPYTAHFPVYGSRDITITSNPRVTKQVEILLDTSGNALAATTTMDYDKYLNVTSTSTYDYAEIQNDPSGYIARSGTIDQMPQGTLLRVTETTYLFDDGDVLNRGDYEKRHLISLPTSTRVKNRYGAVVSEMKMSYDQTALSTYSAITGWTNPGLIGGKIVRGNLTSTQSWLHYTGTTDSYLTTTTKYDQCGNVRETTDAKANKSTITYSAANNLYAYPERLTSPDPDGGTGGSTALVTRSVYHVHQDGAGVEDGTGLLLSTTDANNQTTTYAYDDLNRLLTVTRPAGGGTTTYHYGDDAPHLFVKTETQVDALRASESIQYFDGLGRPSRAFVTEAQATYTVTDTQYDALGRVTKVSNPYRTNALGPTPQATQWATTSYDNHGRVIVLQTPDGAQVITVYDGNKTTVTDQTGKDRQSTTDALGRVTGVVEDPGGLNYSTAYTYDVLDNLIRVEQGEQERTFKYDSLKRLRWAKNPESGTITYEYDENGNLTEKKDARITVLYSYDNLDRLTLRDYSDSTPDVTYTYDASTVANSKGRLTSVSANGATSLISKTSYTGYDTMGRITGSSQETAGRTFQMSYQYNLAGQMTAQVYPSGRRVVTRYDRAGRISSITHPNVRNYADSFSYTPHGAIADVKLGNGLWEHTSFHPQRLQPTEVGLGTTKGGVDRLKLSYDYGTTNNNGNVLRQIITVPSMPATATTAAATGFTVTQHYRYDPLNRLTHAQEVTGISASWQTTATTPRWQQIYTYDQYGNRTAVDSIVNGSQQSLPTYEPAPVIDPLTNRYKKTVSSVSTGFDYDLSGNLKQARREPDSAAIMTYAYDGENRMTQAKQWSTVFGTYTYDGDGRRVKKVVDTRETIFVYNILGQLVAEYENQPQTESGTSYLTMDHLGSTRLVTDQSKGIKARHDYLPFGGEIGAGFGERTTAQGYVGSNLRQKWAQLERDGETGLDYAQNRYYSSMMGRFTSPDDPFADWNTADPQRWNLYSYSSNNPLNGVDPDGERWARRQRSDGLWEYQWFDHLDKDENGQTAYDRALAGGWSEVTDHFVTEHGTGRRLLLGSDSSGKNGTVKEVSALEEFYLSYLGYEASTVRAKQVDDWFEQNWPSIERDLDALPVAGGAMQAGRGGLKTVTRVRDAITKLKLRGLSLTSGMKKLRELGLSMRITKTGRREFFDTVTGTVRAAWDEANRKGGNHWHKFAPDGKTPINDAGRVVEKKSTAAHIPSK